MQHYSSNPINYQQQQQQQQSYHQPSPSSQQSVTSTSDDDGKPRTLWMGDLEPYMDENFIRSLFYEDLDKLVAVKVQRDRYTGNPVGYGFLDFVSNAAAHSVLNKYSNRPMPNVPGRTYRLNWGSFTIGGERRGDQDTPQFAIFVGDLGPEVTDVMLYVCIL